MACQQQLTSHDIERALPSLAPSESPRPSWNCVMDIDSHHVDKRHDHDRTMPSLKKKQRRSVSFQSSSLLFCYGVPEDEPQDWYTGEDEEIFKAEARKELAVFRRMKGGFAGASGQLAGVHQHHRNLCIVGLEQQLISPEFSRKRARTKKLVKYAVLLEQSKAGTGYGDKAERIAEAARRYSEWSAAQAKMFGDFQYIQSKESR
ncbi:hypothetical protein QTG54_008299 [Skeletonema marinoi]|uniref:Uncharacterized protein n=1 Tax=Skeletonema marinoi TaxID=267567 RepID=A0AAD8Y7Q3_9STRA|nr:hypothetical protein QTG54_008299 [Skeletonema marinoi]